MSRTARLRRKADFLKALKSIPRETRNILIQYLSVYACNCLFECTYNILHKPIPKGQHSTKKHLKAHKKDLRFLGDLSKDFIKRKRRLISKSDVLLPLILKNSLPALLAAINDSPKTRKSTQAKPAKHKSEKEAST